MIGIINQDSQAGWLPTIGNQKYLLAILVVAVMTGLMYIYLNYSKQGYEIAVVGESRRTASYAGIKVDRVIIRTMALSGALCGLIGLLLTSSTDHTMTTIVDGRGFTAVMVSWMAKFNPIIMTAAGGAQPRRRRDFHGLRSEPLLRRYPDGHHPVLHHRL